MDRAGDCPCGPYDAVCRCNEVEELRARVRELERILGQIVGPCQGSKRKDRVGKCDCDPCIARAALEADDD